MTQDIRATRIRDSAFAPLRTKVLWTLALFVAFMVGRYIPIPFVHAVLPEESGAQLLGAANVATGANFFSPSLFSLGLGPWMGAAILWRFLFIGKLARARRIPEDTVDRARNVLMVILAIIQAISLTATYDIDGLVWGGPVAGQALAVVILTVGAVIVAWLAQRNEKLGLGGVTMFILYQIVFSALANLESLPAAVAEARDAGVLWLVVAACVGVVLIGILLGNAELRLHVNKVVIDSGFTGVSYLPVKLNPAGASPLMYALALVAIPQYIVHAAGAVIPGAESGASGFLQLWGLSSPLGFTVYLVLLFVLTIFFGLFTVSPRDIGKRMQESGEYFDHVPPGRPTRRFLRTRVVALSAVSGVFLIVFTGIPLFFLGTHPGLQFLLTAPQTLMILLGLLWLLHEEIQDALIGTRYVFSFRAPGAASAGRTA